MKHIYLSCLAIMSALFASAYDFEVNGLFYNLLLEDGKYYAEVTSSNGNTYRGDINIPKTVRFNKRDIPVKYIGIRAFENAEITSISISDSVTEIREKAFCDASITEISIPNSVKKLGAYLFNDNTPTASLKSLNIGSGVKFMEWSFSNITSLETLNIASGVKSISAGAFNNCTSLKKVNLPESIDTIDNSAFRNCISIKRFDFPTSLKRIGYYAFSGCTFDKIVIPNSVTTIDPWAFEHVNPVYVDFGNGVKKINNVFCAVEEKDFCNKIETIIIGSSATTISEDAFSYLTGLKKLVIGEKMRSIGSKAFWGCNNINLVVSQNSTPPTIQENTFPAVTYMSASLIVQSNNEVLQKYRETANWKNFFESNWGADNYIVRHNLKYEVPADSVATVIIKNDDGKKLDPECRTRTGWIITFFVTPTDRYTLDAIIVNGEEISGNTYEILGDTEIKFRFKNSACITFDKNLQGGSLEVTDGKNSINSGDIVSIGTNLSVSASPNTGYFLKYLLVNSKRFDDMNLTVTGNTHISALFEKWESGGEECKDYPNYDAPKGRLESGGNTYLKKIYTENATANINYEYAECPSTIHTVTPTGVIAKPGQSFDIILIANSLGDGSDTEVRQDMRYNKAYIYTDWDGSKTFNEPVVEFGEKSPSRNIYGNYDHVMNISHTVNIPESATGHGRVRVIYSNAWYTLNNGAYSTNINDGVSYDIPVHIIAPSAIEGIEMEQENLPIEYYNLQGIKITEKNLLPGVYIKKRGNKTHKVLIK